MNSTHLDWEWLSEPRDVFVTDATSLAKGLSRVTLRRRNELDIRFTATGDLSPVKPMGPVGSLERIRDIPPVPISYGDYVGELLGASMTDWGLIKEVSQDGAAGIVHAVELGLPGARPAWRSYWLVNVDRLRWPHWTRVEQQNSVVRHRTGMRPRKLETTSSRPVGDHMRVDAGSVHFVMGEVDDVPGITDWKPGFLEVETSSAGELPEHIDVYAAVELIRFLMGTELTVIGRTDYAEDGTSIGRACHDRIFAVGEFRGGRQLPALKDDPIQPGELADVASALLPSFLANREALNLQDALFHLSLGRRLPVGPNISQYATALDYLAKGYFKLHPESNVHIPKGDFERLAREFRTALADRPDADPILKNVHRLNELGHGRRVDRFLDRIKLPIGELEAAALKYRAKAVHGFGARTEDLGHLYNIGRLFERVIVRIVLRLLGYEGTYCDCATDGWPRRALEIPAGGR